MCGLHNQVSTLLNRCDWKTVMEPEMRTMCLVNYNWNVQRMTNINDALHIAAYAVIGR
jgi:predicted urease superfamily metal-dependent hydrolase